MTEIRRIDTRAELIAVARGLLVRPDWHEPDETEVTAEFHGKSFDNAGFWGAVAEAEMVDRHGTDVAVEMWVTLKQEGHPVAEVNLATLFAWATGYEADKRPVDETARSHAARTLRKSADELEARARQLRHLADNGLGG